MAPRKGFGPFTRVISLDLPEDKNWYILNHRVCAMSPMRYLKKSPVVASFQDEFRKVEIGSLCLADGAKYRGKASSEFEVVASSFGLLTVLLRQRPEKSSLQKDGTLTRLKNYLNGLDLSCIEGAETSKLVVKAFSRPRVARRLAMPPTPDAAGNGISTGDMSSTSCDMLKTPSSSGVKTRVPTKNSPNLKEICEDSDLDTPEKTLMVEKRGKLVINDINEVCERHRETLATVLSYMCAFGDAEAKDVLNEVIEKVSIRRGVKRTVEDLVGEETYSKYVESLRVPDWILLYFKTKARISGNTWQAVLNITKLGRTGKSCDTAVLLNTNQIKAVKKVIFDVCREYIGVKRVVLPLKGFGVNMFSVLEMVVREQRLHKMSSPVVQLMLKIDGRPFWGRDQVLIGIVPRVCPVDSKQSSKSVYPLAIANCKENRENLKILLKDVNEQKKLIKQNGISVDGTHHNVEFVVILDYKTLLLLLVKKDDHEFVLGGRGVAVEFCFICNAIRGCSCHDVAPDETCTDCLRTKSNIGRSTGIRDDLLFLLEEELSSIQLCALHMEMRNTEQLLASVGLIAYKIDSLKEANNALKYYGPESFHGDRLTVKKKSEQQSAISRHNIHVSSMSGPTELEILNNIEDIVVQALPLEKLKKTYADLNTSKNLLLNRVSFCQSRVDHPDDSSECANGLSCSDKNYFEDALNSGQFVRDFGTYTEVINLKGSAVKIDMEERQRAWKKELDDLSEIFRKLCKFRRKALGKGDEDIVLCVAKKQLAFLTRVCREWKEIASVTRTKVFQETEQEEIDLFDIKCKEWGFLLKELFGSSLGTGDYGHLTIDHAPMLMRKFLSMTEFSQQGFEAAHKDQRQLWLKASSHDQHGEASSIDQMLVHFYSEKMLFFRYCVREALNSIKGKTSEQQNSYNFHFRGCGWKRKDMAWDTEEINWIRVMDNLMTMMFGGDFLDYDYNEKKICFVLEEYRPKYVYNREDWLSEYAQMMTTSDDMCEGFEDVPLMPSHSTEADNDKNVTEHTNDTSQSMQPSPEAEVFVADDSTGLFVEVHDLDTLQVPSNSVDQDRVVAVFPPPPSVAKITVLQLDLNTLVDGEDLNDSIVDFFMMYLTANAMNQDLKNSQIFSSFFYTKLTERVKIGDRFVLPSEAIKWYLLKLTYCLHDILSSAEERYKKASSFTRNVNLFEKDFIFMPVCRSGHWFLALIYNLPSLYDKGGMIFMIDSIVWSSEDDLFCSPSSREREAELIRSFIKCEWLAKRGTDPTPEFSDKSLPLFYPKVPQQENGYDCGVFLLLFFEEFLKRKFPVDDLLSGEPLRWYDQSSALPLRERIADILKRLGN